MSFVSKLLELPFGFLNSSFYSTTQDDGRYTSYFSTGNLTALFLTVCAGIYLARGCLQQRTITIQDCVHDPRNIFRLQKAVDGRCAVYLGQNFVIKHAGNQCDFRITKMGFADKAIRNNRYSHLIVPNVSTIIQDTYLVEERLPIHLTKDAKTLYETRYSAFTPAVKEFTNLLMRCEFTDLLERSRFNLQFKTPVPRYDNICPFIDKDGRGKLGLVDLEHFESGNVREENEDFGIKIKYCNKATCETLVHLFPKHLDEILEVMEEAGLQLALEDRQALQSARDAQLEQRHSNHIDYL